MELRQGTHDWDEVVKKFVHTFSFFDEKLTVYVALQAIKETIFAEIPVEVASFH